MRFSSSGKFAGFSGKTSQRMFWINLIRQLFKRSAFLSITKSGFRSTNERTFTKVSSGIDSTSMVSRSSDSSLKLVKCSWSSLTYSWIGSDDLWWIIRSNCKFNWVKSMANNRSLALSQTSLAFSIIVGILSSLSLSEIKLPASVASLEHKSSSLSPKLD